MTKNKFIFILYSSAVELAKFHVVFILQSPKGYIESISVELYYKPEIYIMIISSGKCEKKKKLGKPQGACFI